MELRIQQIDHVELTVPDRRVAATWYGDVLGFRIIAEFEFWADDPRGPLMIGTVQAETKLALFEGNPSGSKAGVGFHLVAFRTGATQFVEFVSQLENLRLDNKDNQRVTREMVKDHAKAFSIYFCDPYGNQLEITTYEYDATKAALRELDLERVWSKN